MKPFQVQNYYELLEVPMSATSDQVRHAFERQMQLYADHQVVLYGLTDVDSAKALRERLKEAFEILSDDDLRELYDKDLGLPPRERLTKAETRVAPRATPPPSEKAEPQVKSPLVEHAEPPKPPPEKPEPQTKSPIPEETEPAVRIELPKPRSTRPGVTYTYVSAPPPTQEEPASIVVPLSRPDPPPLPVSAKPVPRPSPPSPVMPVAPVPPVTVTPVAVAADVAPEPPASISDDLYDFSVDVEHHTEEVSAGSEVRKTDGPLLTPPALPSPSPTSGMVAPKPTPALAPEMAQDSAIALAESELAKVSHFVREARASAPRQRPPDLPPDTEYNGEVLRKVRNAVGLSLQQISERTRVSVRHLEAIEADRYDGLPAQVYLRGILMSVSRELGLDGLKVSKSYLSLVDKAKG